MTESHGVVANAFYDHSGHYFNYVNSSSWKDRPEFWGGEPLWITNQKQNGHSGCEFWVGSEVTSRSPTYYDQYDSHKENGCSNLNQSVTLKFQPVFSLRER